MENQDAVVRTFSLAQMVAVIVAALLGSGALSTLVTLFFTRRSARNREIGDEAHGMGELRDMLKDQIHDSVSDAVKLQTAEASVEAYKVVVKARDGQIAEQGKMLSEVLVEQGRAEEREKICQQRLAEVSFKLDGLKDVVDVNKRLVKDNLLLKGMNDDLKRERPVVTGGGDNAGYGE
jgi:hypothetical protein